MNLELLLVFIKQSILSEAENPTSNKELVLSGIPEGPLKTVLTEKGGSFVIKICEIPKEMASPVEGSNISTYLQRLQGAL